MQLTTEDISPAKANAWLENNNTKNRPLKMRHVERLASDMKERRWKKDGMPYRFDVDGNLLDGQHRLAAIAKSGVTLKDQVVITGLGRESFTSMDTGSKRSTADMLHIKGEQNYSTMAGALSVLADYLKNNSIGRRDNLPTPQELLDTLDATPGLRSSIKLVHSSNGHARSRRGNCKSFMAPTLLSGLHYLFAEKDDRLAEVFVSGMGSGYSNEAHPSFHLLRERLMGNSVSKAKLNRSYIAAIAIKAWNAERAKVPLRQLKHTESEDFPNIR